MRKNKRNYILIKESGFTLVEVMIALSVLAFIMMAVITVTESSQNTAERVIREDRESLTVETAMARLEWDFSHIYSPLYFSHVMNPNALGEERAETYNQLLASYQSNERFSMLSFDGLPIPNFSRPDKSTISFFTAANRRKLKNIKQSNFSWVQYSIGAAAEYTPREDDSSADGEEVQGDVLIRKVIAKDLFSPDALDWDDVKGQVLMRKITKLVFEFWNPVNKKWVENIDLIKDGKFLVRGLRVTIKFKDPDNHDKTIMRVYRPLFPQFEPEDMYKYLKGENEGSESDDSGQDGES